jgi:hypothetical protein
MKLRELINEAGFLSSFKQGYQDQQAGRLSTKSQPAPAAQSSSPFDIITARDAKFILQNIINGKPLDANQMALIKKVYSKL